MSRLDAADVQPMYLQLADQLKTQIAMGQYSFGEQIPPEGELCNVYGVSRNTVRRAINHLTEQKILQKKQGKGTFVTVPVHIENYTDSGSFTHSCIVEGSTPGTQILEQKRILCPPHAIKPLCLPEGSEAIYLKRLRLVNQVPTILEEDYFPPVFDFLLRLNLSDQSLLDILWRSVHAAPEKNQYALDIARADSAQAAALNLAEGTPLLMIMHTLYAESKPLYYNVQHVNTAIYKSVIQAIQPHSAI